MSAKTKPSFNEAPCAITTYALAPNGFEVILIMRGHDGGALLKEFEVITLNLVTAGYQPLVESRFRAAVPAASPAANGDAPICAIHHTPMTRMPAKKGGFFWSCHETLSDGSYCPYRPPEAK